MLGTAKLSPLGELLLKISAIRSMETHLKIGKGTPGMRFRSMAMRILADLFKAIQGRKRVPRHTDGIDKEAIQVNKGIVRGSNAKV